jgi:hypothetical protein
MLWWLGGFSDVLSWLGGLFCGATVFLCFLWRLLCRHWFFLLS